MGETRLVLARLPRMQFDLLRQALPPEAGLELCELESVAELPAKVAGGVAAAVLSGDGDSEGVPRVREILERHPGISVLTLSPSGRSATLHRPGQPPRCYDGLSPAELMRVLQEATHA